MGRSRGTSIGCKDLKGWPCIRLPYTPSSLDSSFHKFGLSGCRKEYALERSSGLYVAEGCNRASPRYSYTRILQPPVSCPKENRWLETCYRPFESKQTSQNPNFQNGDGRIHSRMPPPGSMGHVDRPFGRLFPYTDGFSHSQVPPFHGAWGGVPISCAPIWFGNSTKGVHQDCQGIEKDSLTDRNTGVSVHRRLAEPGRFVESNLGEYSKAPTPYPAFRLDGEQRKVGIGSNSNLHFSRVHVRPSERSGFSYGTEIFKSGQGNYSSCELPSNNPKTCHDRSRSHGMHGETGASGSVAHAPASIGAEETVVQQVFSKQENSSVATGSKSPEVVDTPNKCDGIHAIAPTQTFHIHLHGCINGGLGCTHGGVHNPGLVVNRGDQPSYQCSRTQSSSQCIEVANSQVSTAQGNSGGYGQHHGSLLHKQTGGDKVSESSGNTMVSVGLVPQQESSIVCTSHSRNSECVSRPIVTQTSDHSHGVVTRSTGVSRSVQTDIHTSDRFVCDKAQPQVTSVCLASPRSSSNRDRRDGVRLVGKTTVCLSANENGPQSIGKASRKSKHKSSSHSSSLGDSKSFPTTSTAVSSKTRVGSSGSKASEATKSTRVPSKVEEPKPPRILAKDQMKSEGFSDGVIDRVLNPFRDSTKTVYDAKWNCFVKYCQSRKLDANLVTIPQLTQFLTYLFEEQKLQPATIAGYRSALSPYLSHRLGDLGSNAVLSKLVKSFHRDRPRAMIRVQPWDLSIVLNTLTQAPFEPLKDASFKWLTYKTIFLLALASGRRRSELHAIRKDKIFHADDWSTVTCQIDHFLCKNQLYDLSGDMFKSFTIPALYHTVDKNDVEDRSLCPVRALRYYLKRCKKDKCHPDKKALFVPLRDTKAELSKATLSNWIKECITFCLRNCSEETAKAQYTKAHQVRALASSWALKGGVPLQDILHACTWRNHTTFTKFYLKDCMSDEMGTHSIGPFVAAQSVVQL